MSTQTDFDRKVLTKETNEQITKIVRFVIELEESPSNDSIKREFLNVLQVPHKVVRSKVNLKKLCAQAKLSFQVTNSLLKTFQIVKGTIAEIPTLTLLHPAQKKTLLLGFPEDFCDPETEGTFLKISFENKALRRYPTKPRNPNHYHTNWRLFADPISVHQVTLRRKDPQLFREISNKLE